MFGQALKNHAIQKWHVFLEIQDIATVAKHQEWKVTSEILKGMSKEGTKIITKMRNVACKVW